MSRTEKFRSKRRLQIFIILLIFSAAALSAYTVASIFSRISIGIFSETNDAPAYDADAGTKTPDPSLLSPSLPPRSVNENTGTPVEKAESPDKSVEASCLPSAYNFKWDVILNEKTVDGFKREYIIDFKGYEGYSELEGITTFRGNNFRNSPSYGTASVREEKLEKVWFAKTGYIDIWTGVGWNGQPSIVRWVDPVKKKMNIYPGKKSVSDLKEVIYAALDGKIYFLDLADGKETRPAIDTGYPYKGSVAIDPRGYPLLYVGQGINEKNGKPVPIGYRIFNLINQSQVHFINGYDRDARRAWGAFDSVALVDRNTDTLIECGENGLLYTIKLNTLFDPAAGKISIRPDTVKYRYTSPHGPKIGTENSPAIYGSYIFFADNSGLLQCVDLNTMKPVWIRDVSDDTDSSPVLDTDEKGGVWLYTASELDRSGRDGFSYIRKINALTGALVWEKTEKCYYDANTNGGALATPVSGKNEIKNLVIFNIAKTISEKPGSKKNTGKLIAFDKDTGNIAWTYNMDYYSWSSPVDIYTPQGKAYIIICDSGGYMRLLEGKTGKELYKISLEANIEGSPAAYGDMVVVGTRGQKIWGVRIK